MECLLPDSSDVSYILKPNRETQISSLLCLAHRLAVPASQVSGGTWPSAFTYAFQGKERAAGQVGVWHCRLMHR